MKVTSVAVTQCVTIQQILVCLVLQNRAARSEKSSWVLFHAGFFLSLLIFSHARFLFLSRQDGGDDNESTLLNGDALYAGQTTLRPRSGSYNALAPTGEPNVNNRSVS